MHLSKAPAFRVLLPYCSGIVSGYYGALPGGNSAGLILVSGLLAGMILDEVLGKGHSLFSGVVFWICTSGALFFCGWGSISAVEPEDPGLPVDREAVVCGTVAAKGENRNGRVVYTLDVEMVSIPDTCISAGFRLRCYLGSEIDSMQPETGERWLFTGRFFPISGAGNPRETDYAEVMKRQDTWYTFFAEDRTLFNHPLEENKGYQGRENLRRRISANWTGDDEACSLLRAVCLGDRSGLKPEMTAYFSRAGGMHLLAVSGMHVGLIWWVLHRFLHILVVISGKETTRFIPVLLILWCYAWLAGFSSPVLRAVIMFSLYSFSRLLSWRAGTLNVVFVAMLFLLAADPMRVFNAGFQLSFAAVLAILTLQPFLRSLWSPEKRLLKWIWNVITVSLSAQAGIIPLVIYYFNQFPVCGILTNLLAIPVLSCIMVVFVAGFPLLAWGTGAGLAGNLMVLQARIMIRIIDAIAAIPGALITGFSVNAGVTLVSCLAILLLIMYLVTRRFRILLLSGVTLALLLFLSAGHRRDLIHGREALVMNFRGISMVTFREGNVADHYLWARDDEPVAVADRYLEKAWGHLCFRNSVIRVCPGMPSLEFPGEISSCLRISPGTWYVGNDRFRVMVMSGEGYRDLDPRVHQLQPDMLVLREEPGPGGEVFRQLISSVDLVVADGTNRSWYLSEIAGYNSEIHLTPYLGAFRVDY